MDDTPLSNSRSYAPPERLRVSIELTNICNFACPFCPQAYKHDAPAPGGSPYNRRQGLMSRAVFARAVDECNRVAVGVHVTDRGDGAAELLGQRAADVVQRRLCAGECCDYENAETSC